MPLATDGIPDAADLRKIALEQAALRNKPTSYSKEDMAAANKWLEDVRAGKKTARDYKGLTPIFGKKYISVGGDAGGVQEVDDPSQLEGWSIGGDDNLNWTYDTNGNLVNVAHHNTDDTGMALTALIAAGLAGAAGTGLIGAGGASGTGATAAADGASKALTVRDLTQWANILRNPTGAATAAVLGKVSPETKDYLDLVTAVTGKNPVTEATKAVTGGTKPDGTKTDGTKADDTKGSDAYGIPLGLLAMLGAQGQQQQRPQIDPTYRPGDAAIEFDPFR